MSTDLGEVDQQTTMGVSTGDLKGAVSATILDGPDGKPRPNGIVRCSAPFRD
jgi:hypothetical protein